MILLSNGGRLSQMHLILFIKDDVILMSFSSAGLQSKLDLLQAFCEDLCLSINSDKTKMG